MAEVWYTHKGWFGACPIYLSIEQIVADAGPTIEPRHWVYAPLMWISEAAFGAINFLMSSADPGFVCGYPIRITGRAR